MALPQPPQPLDNICSVLHNNILYTYSAGAFQSLALEKGAQWKSLPLGESVTNGVCVGSTPTDDSNAAFWVVGGNGNTTDYKGLQKYTYTTGKWESITPVVPVTQNRIGHGATYLPSSNTIVVYAGVQGGNDPVISTQTFAVSTVAPYGVLAYESTAPPSIKPIFLPWTSAQAAMIGGSTTNTKVMLFSAEQGWADSGATLSTPLQTGDTTLSASIMNGDDGSRILYTFDMSKSPNVVNHMILLDGKGAPIKNAPSTQARSTHEFHSKARHYYRRAAPLTSTSWPTYNDTFAGTSTRTNYAVASDSNGLVVMAGGNDDDPLCMFDGKANSWQNAVAELVDPNAQVSIASATATPSPTSSNSGTLTSATPTSTSPSTSPTTSASLSSSDTNSSSGISNQALGAILGTVSAALILLIIGYCLLRRKKSKQAFAAAGHSRRSSGISQEPEKDTTAFAKDNYISSPASSKFRGGHQQQNSDASYSSMAILMGKHNQKKSMDSEKRPKSSLRPSHDSHRTFDKNTISGPMTHASPRLPPMPPLEPMIPEEQFPFGVNNSKTSDNKRVAAANTAAVTTSQSRAAAAAAAPNTLVNNNEPARRSSGWGKYWSGDSAAILGFGARRKSSTNTNTNRNTTTSDSSRYSNVNDNRHTQDSATVPPLNLHPTDGHLSVGVGVGSPQFKRVVSGSPTLASHPDIPHRFNQATSVYIDDGSSSGNLPQKVGHTSQGSAHSGYSSGIPASVHDHWDPTSVMSRPYGAPVPRAPSSQYSAGGYGREGGGGGGGAAAAAAAAVNAKQGDYDDDEQARMAQLQQRQQYGGQQFPVPPTGSVAAARAHIGQRQGGGQQQQPQSQSQSLYQQQQPQRQQQYQQQYQQQQPQFSQPHYHQQQQHAAYTGISQQPQLAMATTSSDMSWLNLGDQGHDRR